MGKEVNVDEMCKHFNQRIDELENLIKLSLMSEALSEYTKIIDLDVKEKANQLVNELGLNISKTEFFGDRIIIYVNSEKKMGLKDIRYYKKQLESVYKNFIFVFELQKVNSLQRTKFIEEKISFCVKGKELYVTQ